MGRMSQVICSLLVIVCIALVPTTSVTTAGRRSLIDAAIREAKDHAEAQNEAPDIAGSSLLAFKQASPHTLKHGQARLLYEDIVRRAEMKILDKEREEVQAGDIEGKAEILAKELLNTPGRLLTEDELARVYEVSDCPNLSHVPELNCTDQTNSKYRTPNGQCNNLDSPLLGAAPSVFRRLLPPRYEDGVSQLRGTMQSEHTFGANIISPYTPPNPSARTVSNKVVRDKPVDEQKFTHLLMQWGQWTDHGLSEAPMLPGCPQNCEIELDKCVPIPVSSDDPKLAKGCIVFPRTVASCGDDAKVLKPRQQINDISSFIDGSQVYGSSVEWLDALRENNTPFLKTGKQIPAGGGNSLPLASESDIENKFVGCPGGVASGCFLAGDIRVNEVLSITVMHTMWMREHNRIAKELNETTPWSADKIFHVTRDIVAAEIQKITYKDFLPYILGQTTFEKLIGNYTRYHPDVDPTIPNAFATAAYRFGHSLIRPEFDRLDENYRPLPIGPLSLVEMFFKPVEFENSNGTDPLLRGMLHTSCRRSDEFLNSILTQQLFAPSPSSFGMDLASLNIQRGRDHGLPPYHIWKTWAARNDTCGMSSEIRDYVTKMRLLETYGSLDTVDLWVGGLAEARVPGGLVGATFACIFAETFRAIRDGDRFFYENVENGSSFTNDQRDEINKVSLSRIICDNADDITQIQSDAFLTHQPLVSCTNESEIAKVNLSVWATEELDAEYPSIDKEKPDAENPSINEEELIDLVRGLIEKLDEVHNQQAQESTNNQAHILSELEDALLDIQK